MDKNILFSIHNGGESIEKSLALCYCTFQYNFDFYNQFDMEVFYSYNLPKTNQNIESSGSVGFYAKYFSDYFWCPPCKKDFLWANKEDILNKLIYKGKISQRVADKLSSNVNLFWDVLRRIPFEYLYPEFYKKLLNETKRLLENVKFISTDLINEVINIYDGLPFDKKLYSIYSLESNGVIGHYDMDIPNDYRYFKRLEHLFSSLNKQIVLSGNSAIFIASINNKINKKGLVGYRNHKYPRASRDFALNQLLINKESIIEPKNVIFNTYYDKININDNETKSNEVVAMAYSDFVNNNVLSLKL